MKASVHLGLLGDFRITLSEGVEVPLHGKKKRGLLAYLALSPNQTISRDKAISVLWSQRDEERQAKPSLRTALSELRKLLRDAGHEDILSSDRTSISLTPEVEVDTTRLKHLAKSQVISEKRLALELYRGDLLECLDLRDRAFEDWIRIERIQYRELFREILNDLLVHSIHTNSLDDGIQIACRMLALDETDEEAHRALMQMYESKGSHARALKQFENCREALEREVQGAPSQETLQLYGDIASSHRSVKIVEEAYERTISDTVVHSGAEGVAIGVLPFLKQGDRGETDFLTDAISEDIITALSRFKWIAVLPRSATFSLRPEVPEAAKIGEVLGLKYVIDGTVRQADNFVRVLVELIEVDAKKVLWSQAYDGEIYKNLSVQAEITAQIVSQIDARLRMNEVKEVLTWKTNSPRAYDCLLRAISNMHEMTRESFAAARELFDQAVQLDPDIAAIYSWWALREIFYVGQGWDQKFEKGKTPVELAQQARKLDPGDAIALAICGHAKSFIEWEFSEAKELFERSLFENPNSAFAWMLSSATYSYCGESAEALRRLEHSTGLCPVEPLYEFMYDSAMCLAHSFARNYKEAARYGRRLVRESPKFANGYKQLLVPLGHLGASEEAKEYTRRLFELEPDFSVQGFRKRRPFKHETDRVEFVEGLIKAGVPSSTSVHQ